MNIVEYIRKNGFKRVFQVIYRYKIDRALRKMWTKLLKNKPLQDIIVIESHNDFDQNGGAFYDYLIENGYNRKYRIIWLLKHKKPGKMPENVSCFWLYRPSIRKDYYISRAKYLLADNTVTEKVRPDQISVYCGHGFVSLKETRGLLNVPDSVDYILSPSANYDEILAWELSVPYPTDRLVHLGGPCEDVYFRQIPDEFGKITPRKYSKKILWMPTFRKGGGFRRTDSERELPYGIPLIEDKQMFDALDSRLRRNDVLLVIKIHPMQDMSAIRYLGETENIKVLTGESVKKLGIDNYRLLSCTDALLSDYSSVAYSFLLKNKPLGFVLSDLQDYKLGLCVDNVEDYLVGHKIFTFDDLMAFLEDVLSGTDSFSQRRIDLLHWLYEYQDGDSCKRLADFLKL